jgi:hypothetical protein
MDVRHKAPAIAFALVALCSILTSEARGRQAGSQRRPQGPVAGPAIKLPRGEGAGDERAPQQQQSSGAKETTYAPLKWEYCSINGFNYHQKGLGLSAPSYPSAVVRYFSGGGEEVEGQLEEEALANAFAKLGEDGWELTGVRTDFDLKDGNGKSTHVYFFKRPKKHE